MVGADLITMKSFRRVLVGLLAAGGLLVVGYGVGHRAGSGCLPVILGGTASLTGEPVVTRSGEAFRWMASSVSDEAALDEVLRDQGWVNNPVYKQRFSVRGEPFLMCVCTPYSGVSRAHAMLFVGGNPSFRLACHLVIDGVNNDKVVARVREDGQISLVSRAHPEVTLAMMAWDPPDAGR